MKKINLKAKADIKTKHRKGTKQTEEIEKAPELGNEKGGNWKQNRVSQLVFDLGQNKKKSSWFDRPYI